MTGLLWSSIGLSLGAAILFASLALRRPLDRTQLAFAGMMTLLAAFLYFGTHLYRADTPGDAVEATRWQMVAVHGFIACALVFVPAYTNVHPSRWLLALLAGLLGVFLLANLITPYGVWFSAPPTVTRTRFLGEPYASIVAPPMSALQIAYSVYMIGLQVIALVMAGALYRRGQAQRATAFAVSVVIIIAANLADVIRDACGGSWLYVTEYGLVALGLVMSVQLAREFRQKTERLAVAIDRVSSQADQLTSILGALRELEERMRGSMATLESAVARLGRQAGDGVDLARLRRAVLRLREVSSAISPEPARRATPRLL